MQSFYNATIQTVIQRKYKHVKIYIKGPKPDVI